MIAFFRILTFLLISVPTFCDLIPAKIVRVIDGDSVHVKKNESDYFVVRLFGIDAPELDQRFGRRSKKYLEKLTLNQSVKIQLFTKDNYGRQLALIFDKAGRNINLEMVQSGYAWVYQHYNPDPKWLGLQEQAKNGQLGLWQRSKPIPPWIFRRK